MRKLLWIGIGMVLVVTALVGCKSEPETPKATAPAAAAEVTWQWPLSDDRITELRDMPVGERNRVMRGMVPPTYDIHRAAGAIKINGVPDEDDWKRAGLIRMVDVGHGTPSWYATTVRILYDDVNLYVVFECDDPNVASSFEKHDDPTWKQDVVELFIDANGDEKSYVELHVSPANVQFDAVWADFRDGADWFTQPTWERFEPDTAVGAYNAPGIKSAVRVKGTLNESDDTDEGYTVELAIPFAALCEVRPYKSTGGKVNMNEVTLVPIKMPKPGTTWRMNLLRYNPSAPLLLEGELSAWSPTGASVHVPCSFGHVRFMAEN